MKYLLLTIIVALISCSDLTDPTQYADIYVKTVITSTHGNLPIEYNRMEINSQPFTNYYTNTANRYFHVDVKYQSSCTNADISVITWTNDVLFSSNNATGTNIHIEYFNVKYRLKSNV